jgi:branched-chain amino acid transport system substrate-binding protein
LPGTDRLRAAAALAALAAFALAAPAATRAADPPSVKIGVIYSYTGSTANAGKAFDAALNAWMRLHHDLAGGRKVEFFRRDDTGPAPDVARREAQELVVQEHVDFLIGSVYTPNAVAIETVSAQAKVPFFIVNAGTTGILAGDPYAVRMGATFQQTTTPLGRWAARNAKTAFTMVSDYAPGIDAEKSFVTGFQAAGGTIDGGVRAPLASQDFSPYAQRAHDAKPGAVFGFVVAGSPAVAFFRAMHQAAQGQKSIPIMVNGATVDEYDLPAMGDAPADAISSIQYLPTLRGDLNARFTKAFATEFGGSESQQPDFMAEAGYDSMTVIDRAVAAQKTAQLDPDASMQTIRGLSIESPRGPFRIDAQTREPVQNIYICRTIMRGGRAVNMPLETIRSVNASGTPE